MADGISDEKVHKSLVMERELAGAINAWAVGAGVGFSEAVRRLCAQALAEWPDAAGAVVDELRCAEGRLSDGLERIAAAIARIESSHAELLGFLQEIAASEHGENLIEGSSNGYLDSGDYGEAYEEDESDREFDKWFEGLRREWE